MKSCKAFLLRMNPDLYKEIEAWAQQELRSVNGQIEFLLKEAVKKRRQISKSEDATVSSPIEDDAPH